MVDRGPFQHGGRDRATNIALILGSTSLVVYLAAVQLIVIGWIATLPMIAASLALSVAAVLSARAGLRRTPRRTPGRRVAITAAVVASLPLGLIAVASILILILVLLPSPQ